MKLLRALLRYFNIVILLVFVLVAALSAGSFFTMRNLLNIVQQITVLALLSLGMTFVVLCGQMDLSVGAIMTFTGLIAISFQGFMPVGWAMVSAVAIGGAIGLINGLIMVATKANSGESLMITFGTQLVLAGFSLVYTKGFAFDGSSSAFFNAIGTGRVGGIPVTVLIVAAFTMVLSFIDGKTSMGRSIHMIGYNAEASRLSGLSLGRAKAFCYTLSGMMAACGAIVLSSRTLGATPTAGEGYEMDAIVAIVLGGSSLSGGSGSVFNTFIGILILGILGNIMNLLGFMAFDQMIVKGIILITAVFVDTWNPKQALKA